MKFVRLSRGRLELARAPLGRPLATIGRSPVCDIVLRAEGVQPVHFLLEWVGAGEFDPASSFERGQWTIFDVSSSGDVSGEGVILGREPVDFQGFDFEVIEDQLASQPELGGMIRSGLDQAAGAPVARQTALVEFVQIRTDSGAVEQVLHLAPAKLRKSKRVSPTIPEFRIAYDGGAKGVVRAVLEQMPGAVVCRRGVEVESAKATLGDAELLEIEWKEHSFYLRWVNRVAVPKEAGRRDREPLLYRLFFLTLAGTAAILGVWSYFAQRQVPEPPAPPPRIATIEIKQVAPPPPPPPVVETPASVEAAPVNPNVGGGAAAAPRERPIAKPKAKPKAGLNSPVSPPADVNSVGLLGALKRSSAPKGPGVNADKILNGGVVTSTVSGDTKAPAVVVAQSPQGALGSGRSGGDGAKGEDLSRASTTLNARSGFDSRSSGAIASEGGKVDASGLGAGTSNGSGLGTGSGSAPGISGGADEGSVSGGLDKETVRRVIARYRGAIRACYERGLIAQPGLNGRIVYRWEISPQGPVSTVKLQSSTASSGSLEGCVLEVIRSMAFPAAPNGRPTTVIYPFVFQKT